MGIILTSLLRFIGRNTPHFLVIVVVLAFGRTLYDEATEKLVAQAYYETWRKSFDEFVRSAAGQAKARSRKAVTMTTAQLDARISAIETEMAANSGRRPKFISSPQKFVESQKIDIANSYLEQERMFLSKLREHLLGIANLDSAKVLLEQLRQNRDKTNKAYQTHEAQHVQFNQLPWYKRWFQKSLSNQLTQDHVQLDKQKNQAYDAHQSQDDTVSKFGKKGVPPIPVFEPNDELLEGFRAGLEGRIHETRSHWLLKAMDLFKSVALQALTILAGILLMPLAIKSLFYYVIAPVASRRSSMQVPGQSAVSVRYGQIGKVSNVLADLAFVNDEELLLLPEYVHSSPTDCEKDTKWVLSRRFIFTSMAAGMYGLTRFRTNSSSRVVACAKNDPLAEIAVIEIPDGSSMVLEPHNLIGIIQRCDSEMKIVRHWHLTNLTAWLTLQLRSLVFIGPGRIVVKGCRGVKLEQANGSRNINQGATIGYSANLNRSVQRCDTFWPYMKGDEELFNDRFNGDGVCIYTESTYIGKSKGLFGKGIEGVVDSTLKVFGI